MLRTASDLFLVILVLLVAFLFFGAIPGIGAFTVRARWRRFRARILQSSLRRFVQYSDLRMNAEGQAAEGQAAEGQAAEGQAAEGQAAEGYAGSYRAFGSLEALQGRDRIWINTGRFTVGADLEGVQVYLLPSSAVPASDSPLERLESSVPDEEPSMVSWDRIYSLPAGTQVFVEGALFAEDGQAVFRTRGRHPLLVVIYDGDRRTILQRAIWSGRQKNEYWNQFTLAALLTGAFLLIMLAYLFLRVRGSGLPSLLALSLAAFPVAALLPPGVLLYFVYRHFWKRARLLRGERDLLRLPLRYFQTRENRAADDAPDAPREPESDPASGEVSIRLPTGERYLRTRESSWLVKGGLVIRGSQLAVRGERPDQPGWLFGVVDEGAEVPSLRTPEDPMAELVLVLGDPEQLAGACSRTARVYELASAASFFAAVILNLFLLLTLWHLVIR